MIQTSSAGHEAGNYCLITINNVPVPLEDNWSGHHRGLNVVIINPSNCKVEFAGAFDTYKSNSEFEDFCDYEIPPGMIVTAACKDECAKNLSIKCERFFTQMGSRLIKKVRYRDSFAFIGIIGKRDPVESVGKRRKDSTTV